MVRDRVGMHPKTTFPHRIPTINREAEASERPRAHDIIFPRPLALSRQEASGSSVESLFYLFCVATIKIKTRMELEIDRRFSNQSMAYKTRNYSTILIFFECVESKSAIEINEQLPLRVSPERY